MKKQILSIIIVAVVACLSFTSCKTVSYQARGVEISNHDIVCTRTVVDVQVDLTKRITYKDDHYVKYDQSISRSQTEEMALNTARYACIMQNNIDVVVDPVYKIYFKGMGFKKAKIELTGFAGYYRNARTVNEDINSLKNYSMDDLKKYILFNNPSLLKNESSPINITFPNDEK